MTVEEKLYVQKQITKTISQFMDQYTEGVIPDNKAYDVLEIFIFNATRFLNRSRSESDSIVKVTKIDLIKIYTKVEVNVHISYDNICDIISLSRTVNNKK